MSVTEMHTAPPDAAIRGRCEGFAADVYIAPPGAATRGREAAQVEFEVLSKTFCTTGSKPGNA